MATPYSIPQNFSTTLNAGGGIDDSQTTGIILTSVSGLPTDGGILCLDWSASLDTATAEYIEYTGISGNELTGVTRGAEGLAAKAHSNGATVVGVVSQAHIKRLRDKLTSNDAVAVQDPNGNEIIKTAYVSSAVNEITTTNSATGNAPSITATGGDTNIGITLAGKGTGAVKLGQSTSTGVELVADQPVNDSAGNEYIKFSKTASAVNEITVTNAATGNPPILEATGGDTNIHLVARAKGSGLLKTSVLRQDNTTNAYKHNSVILTGWGFITGDASNSRLAETVTFGITFAAAPIVTISFIGYKANSDPTAISEFTTTTDNQLAFRALSIATTGFSAEFKGSGAPATSERVGYSWTAIGELA